jgi:hypothetical protein
VQRNLDLVAVQTGLKEERMEALRVCAENKLPPELIVMHMGITENPHHDTAGIFERY